MTKKIEIVLESCGITPGSPTCPFYVEHMGKASCQKNDRAIDWGDTVCEGNFPVWCPLKETSKESRQSQIMLFTRVAKGGVWLRMLGEFCGLTKKVGRGMSDKREPRYTMLITCPYCGWEDQDTWECGMENDDERVYECGKCEKEFDVECYVLRTFSSYAKEDN